MNYKEIEETIKLINTDDNRIKVIDMVAMSTVNLKKENYVGPDEVNNLLNHIILDIMRLKGMIMATSATNLLENALTQAADQVNPNSDMQMIHAEYNKEENTFSIDLPENAIDKKYLKYLMEHLKIPADAKVIFKNSN